MRRPFIATLTACLVSAGTLAALPLPATASTGTASSEAPSAAQAAAGPPAAAGRAAAPAMLRALERDLHLAPGQAKARLAREQKASALERTVRQSLGTAFAGAWLSADGSTLTVAATTPAAAAAAARAGATTTLARYSLADLAAAQARLDAAAAAAPSGVTGWYADVRTNRLVVQALPQSLGAARAFAEHVLGTGAPLQVTATAQQPRLLYNVVGGQAYYIASTSRCSIGFSVTGGFVSAGHCGSSGDTTTGYNQVSQGTFRGSSFPGNDYSWVAVNSSWTPTGYVDDGSGGTVAVNGSTEAAVGASVCRSGSTTGWHCGTIQAKNQTVTYSEGSVSGLTRTNACAEAGDSGGSWLSGNQAQGVTSGGSGDCTSGGTTYFQPVSEILSAYGLTLTTASGSGGGGSSSCSGYAATYSGSLSGSGSYAYQPNGTYYYSSSSGTHAACLSGPSGADFDLYLLKWNGSSWSTVASSEGSTSSETISYSGTAGYYMFEVYSYSGSGSYSLGITHV